MITLGFTCAERKICSIIKKPQNIMNMIADPSLISLSFFGSVDFFSFVPQFCRILTISKLGDFVLNIFKFWIVFVYSFLSCNLCLQMSINKRDLLHSLPNNSEKENVSLDSEELLVKEVAFFLNLMILYHQQWMKSVTSLCSIERCPRKAYFCIFCFDNDYFKRVYKPIFWFQCPKSKFYRGSDSTQFALIFP